MQVAGSNAHNMTNLTAGMDPEGAKKPDLAKVGTALRNVFIEAADATFPGVNVRIGDSQRQVKSPMKSARFEMRGESMVVH